MRKALAVSARWVAPVFALLGLAAFSATPDRDAPAPVAVSASSLNSGFEANRGQTDEAVRFLARGRGHTLFLTDDAAVMALRLPEKRKPSERGRQRLDPPRRPDARPARLAVLRMIFDGANPAPKVTGEQALPGKVNVYVGDDPTAWHTDVPSYNQVRYRDLYPGVDLAFAFGEGGPSYTYVIAPGADPQAIRLRLKGARKVKVAANGDLVLRTRAGEVRHRAPRIFQTVDGRTKEVEGGFTTNGKRVGFKIGEYDRSKPLVIDPTIEFSGVIGGSGSEAYFLAMATAPDGTVHIAGATQSVDFPGADPAQNVSNTSTIVAGFDLSAQNAVRLYATYLESKEAVLPGDIAVDADGNVYVTGSVTGPGFPVIPGSSYQDTWGGGGSDAFLAMFSQGHRKFSTYLGGSGDDTGHGIAVVSGSGSDAGIYIAGGTASNDIQSDVTPLRPLAGGSDAFIAKMDLDATAVVSFTYLGGSDDDSARDIAVRKGESYVMGHTGSSDFWTRNPVQPTFGNTGLSGSSCSAQRSGGDAFVAKLNAAGDAFLFSTFLGGAGDEVWNWDTGAIDVDSQGDVYVAGAIDDCGIHSFPTTGNAYLRTAGAPGTSENWKTFVAKIAMPSSGTPSLEFSTYLGKYGHGYGTDLAVNPDGNAYVVSGTTGGRLFADLEPFPDSYQGDATGGPWDAVISKLDVDGRSLLYWGRLGGSSFDIAYTVALAADDVYVGGVTSSLDFQPPPQGAFGGASDFFIVKLSEGAVADTPTLTVSDATADQGCGLEIEVHPPTDRNDARPAVAALADGGFVVAWESTIANRTIFGQRFDGDGAKAGDAFQASVGEGADERNAQVAGLTGGWFVVTWDASADVFRQTFDASGTTIGGTLRVNHHNVNQQSYSAIAALDDGGYLVVWQSVGADDDGFGVAAQRFDAGRLVSRDGSTVGRDEYLVNENAFGFQGLPALAQLADGTVVHAWSYNSLPDDPNVPGDVRARLFDDAGAPIGAEFPVNTATTGEQGRPRVAALAGGGFVVVWESRGGNHPPEERDGSGRGIFAQRYDANGSRVGNEFRVNSQAMNDQEDPSVTALADGGFVVTWSSFGHDEGGGPNDPRSHGVYAQRYDANGDWVGGELLVNVTTAEDQYWSDVTALADGSFVVAWRSDSPANNQGDILARICGMPDGTPVPLDITAALTDTDGSETLSITIAGVPNDASLSAGTDSGGGTWTLAPDDLEGLVLTTAPGFAGQIVLTVTATATEQSNGDTASTSEQLRVTVAASS